jgi:class 3 adenylate cyclase/tetratricopeptide (TPR) repeat protein/predicted Ser/Thr protein kinase
LSAVTPPADGGRGRLPSRIGNYRVEQQLGAGGMGAVYRGFDEALHRPLAIKRLLGNFTDQTAALRFRREARMAARLNHPAIVHIYDIVENADGVWIVMELVEGRTLDNLMREGRPELARTVRLVREVAEGLAEAHAHGIVHRDLKASNIMVNAAGRAKILDFGLAKIYTGATEADISAAGAIVGTFHAMSPEQAQGLSVDHRSDLFSLGTLLYEMLTGISPFYAGSPPETLARVCAFTPRSVRDINPRIPEALAELTMQLLNKAPEQRPQRTADVAATLARIEYSGALADTHHDEKSNVTTSIGTIDLNKGRGSTPGGSERRQLTVIGCEVVDAGPGGPSLDPEILYEAMLQVRPLAQSVADRYGGTVGRAAGDRVLIYFGHPKAQEDDAARAVQAALELVAAAGGRLNEGGSTRVGLRAGVHTGLAVVSNAPDHPDPAFGATLDIALRLEASAAPGSVVISTATRSLVQRRFATEPLPPLPPSGGASEPLVRYAAAQQDDSVADAMSLIPLVGRERELDLIVNRWEQARAGTGQAVLISGEAGIGKSRLLQALRERVVETQHERGVRWLSVQGVAYTQNTPLHAVVTLLKQMLESERGDTPLSQLQSLLDRFSLGEAAPLFASLLDLSAADRPPVPPMPPERQREQTLEALVALLLEMSERETVVLVVEDLHWLDATSLAWLERLIGQTATAPMLLVMTIRLNTVDMPWGSHARVTQLTLGALSGAETEKLIQLVSGTKALPTHLRQQIASQTDGVPLFVEEMTRSVLDWGDSSGGHVLPTTLRDSLTARLDRLGSAKDVAQLAAVIGRVFTWRLLAAIAHQSEDVLQRELRSLVQSGLVHQRGFGAQTRYTFKHALIRDAAYDSLLRRERQQMHLRIATAMDEARQAGTDKVQSEEIAHHYMTGEQFDRAFACYFEAGQAAIGRSAHHEAIGHLRQALAALQRLPASPERDQRELGVQSALAVSLGVTQGQSAHDVEACWNRVLELAETIGAPGEIYFGLWNFYASRAQLAKARALGQERLDFGTANNDIPSLFLGLYTTAASDMFIGNVRAARAGFEKLLSMYPRDMPANNANSYDMGIVTQSLLGDILWQMGLVDTGLRMMDDATERGQQFSPFTHSICLVDRISVSSSMKDHETTLAVGRELTELSAKHYFHYWTINCAVALAIAGLNQASSADEIDQGLKTAADAVNVNIQTGAQLQSTRYLAWVTTACLRYGRAVMARKLLDEAKRIGGEETYWESDLRRLDALTQQAEGASLDQVERTLREAMAMASRQGALTFELWAALDLGRLLREQGRLDEARSLLADRYNAFTEGFDTPDLKAARALLEQFGPAS